MESLLEVWEVNFRMTDRKYKSDGEKSRMENVRWDQKRFIYRLLTRHDFLPVWLVADK